MFVDAHSDIARHFTLRGLEFLSYKFLVEQHHQLSVEIDKALLTRHTEDCPHFGRHSLEVSFVGSM